MLYVSKDKITQAPLNEGSILVIYMLYWRSQNALKDAPNECAKGESDSQGTHKRRK